MNFTIQHIAPVVALFVSSGCQISLHGTDGNNPNDRDLGEPLNAAADAFVDDTDAATDSPMGPAADELGDEVLQK